MSNKTQRGGAKLTASGKRLRVRTAERSDIPGIVALSKRVYQGTGIDPYSTAELRGQLLSLIHI